MRTSWLLVLFCFSYLPFFGQDDSSTVDWLVRLDSVGDTYDLDDYFSVWIDTTGEMPWEKVRDQVAELPFQEIDSTLGDRLRASAQESILWMHGFVDNPQANAAVWYFWDQTWGSYMDMYATDSAGGWVHQKTGTLVAKKERDVQFYHYLATKVPLQAGERREIFIRLQDMKGGRPWPNVVMQHEAEWEDKDMEETLIYLTGFLTLLGTMCLYSLMVFIATREKTYAFYCLYILSIMVFLMFTSGPHAFSFYPKMNNHMLIAGLSGLSIFYFMFGRSFLRSWELIPKADRWIKGYIWLRSAILLIQLLLLTYKASFYNNLMITEFIIFFIEAGFALALCIVLLRTGSVLARYFVAGSAIVFVFALTYLSISLLILRKEPEFEYFFGSILAEILIFSLGLGYRMKKSEKDKLEAQEKLNAELTKVNTAFGRFVPHEFIKSLGHDSILDVKLGDGVEKEVTVLFSDIRDYTSLSEKMTPQENFHFLNAYLGRMGPVISQHHGFVNQYYGDGIMALFLQSPDDALRAALDMQRVLHHYNAERDDKERLPIRTGLGLHTGPLMMGVIGDTLRLEAGVVADTVNTAARMEGLTKFYGGSLLVSETTFNGLERPDAYPHRFLGKALVKGRKEALGVYEFYGAADEAVIRKREQTRETFCEGLNLYFDRHFAQAAHAFDAVLEIDADDKSAHYFREQSTHHLLTGVEDGWNGVVEMMQK
ncbi:MAG: adenylate/guanylate cyclase domain-containing protein [Bacteroidota bacterium]